MVLMRCLNSPSWQAASSFDQRQQLASRPTSPPYLQEFCPAPWKLPVSSGATVLCSVSCVRMMVSCNDHRGRTSGSAAVRIDRLTPGGIYQLVGKNASC
jgi:hypothetical protein